MMRVSDGGCHDSMQRLLKKHGLAIATASAVALVIVLGLVAAAGLAGRANSDLLLWLLAGVGLLLVVALATAWRFSARIESPLADLLHAVERLSAGDWVARIDVPHGRIGGALGSAIERLRINLSDHAATGRAFDIMLDSMNDAVFITSPDGLIKRVNLAATQLLGWSQMELLGRELAYVISDQDRPNFSIEQAVNETLELTVRTQAGQVVPVSLSGSVMASEDPRFQGCIFVARNITERKRAERRIRYLARYDTLTKIPNRMQFQHRCSRRSRAPAAPAANSRCSTWTSTASRRSTTPSATPPATARSRS